MTTNSDNMRELQPEVIPEKKIIVLKDNLKPIDAKQIMDKKKTTFFGSTLKRPKHDELKLEFPKLIFEQFLFLSGKYEIDYNRKSLFRIMVDANVKDVEIGKKKFSILSDSSKWKLITHKMKESIGIGKQELFLEGEEHAFQKFSKFIYLNSSGIESDVIQDPTSDIIDKNPTRILQIHKDNIMKMSITTEFAIKKLVEKLQNSLQPDITINSHKLIINEITEFYVPIYEAYCSDSTKHKVIIRVDAINKNLIK